MKTRKNALPVAPFNLRERGPVAQAALTKEVGFFRFAHGVGADRRATVDPKPCPTCRGKVEWALTYKREGKDAVPYIYARCRTSPKSHRWDFSHFEAKPVPPMKRAAREYTPPRPSVGTELMASWIDKKIETLSAELEKLAKIRQLAGEVQALETKKPIPSPIPSYPGVAPNGTPV